MLNVKVTNLSSCINEDITMKKAMDNAKAPVSLSPMLSDAYIDPETGGYFDMQAVEKMFNQSIKSLLGKSLGKETRFA